MSLSLLTPPASNVLELRPYQVETIEQLRDALRKGYKRIILCAPTGAGKCHPAGTRGLRGAAIKYGWRMSGPKWP